MHPTLPDPSVDTILERDKTYRDLRDQFNQRQQQLIGQKASKGR